MSKSTLKKVALYTLGAFSGVALSLSVQSYAANKDKAEALPVQSIRTMAEVYGQIKANYYQDKSDDKLIEGAMKGMVAGLDPHSEYMTKKDYADLKESTSGEFGGLGMEVGSEDGFVKVVAPIEDTPAERAGVKSGDFIVKINGVSTRGMTVNEAVKKMRGKPGTDIVLTLSRKDATKPITVKITRAIIKVRSVRHHLLEPGYGYIRISQFQERTVAALNESAKALNKQNKAPLKGLVLDLRDDPGGLLNGAVGVSAAFLPAEATVVSTKGRDGRGGMSLKAVPEDYMLTTGKDPLHDLPAELKSVPVTVLINSGSASASEIVAGALQDHRRAVIVGTQSFGKGSVQTVLPLSNGSAIKLTTALYYTPKDRSIQAQGIVPDVEIKDKNRLFESREADLLGHIGNPFGGEEVNGKDYVPSEPEPAPKAKGKKDKKDEDISSRRIPNPAKDDQLKKALDLIKSPAQWQKSLGLAAKKPAPKKEKSSE
ncbi:MULTISPECIES: S41 family peptidase [unclassified Neisseria]|uniref:S41 family peptidase n=1 Tax=unclassified Neisseria TaxID=2623750 RepID=UPI002665C38D|nr:MULTISPECIES: S41 family peptidase [unclassified Neisseria]MDO1508964.1 S41 family peptidase [Neisseria sp. MVDL19-042950]MDO1515223.1 S41 family peptidase [Neisseria sp. MVDL18-041461]MDO1562583.1 S41 family peptidase [Neisseria sp. MVDL20-010259]